MEDNIFLPIGTVVLLKNAKKKVMITGFSCVDPEKPDEIYDYSGCLYPEGFLTYDQIGLFNNDQIDEIYHLGYIDEEEKEFKGYLNELLKQGEEDSKEETKSEK